MVAARTVYRPLPTLPVVPPPTRAPLAIWVLTPTMPVRAVCRSLSSLPALYLHVVPASGRIFKGPTIVAWSVAALARMGMDAADMMCTRTTVGYATSVGTRPTSVTAFVKGALLDHCRYAQKRKAVRLPLGPSVSAQTAPAPLHGMASVASTAALRAAMAPPVRSTITRAPRTTSPRMRSNDRHVTCDRPLSRPVRRGCTATSAVRLPCNGLLT